MIDLSPEVRRSIRKRWQGQPEALGVRPGGATFGLATPVGINSTTGSQLPSAAGSAG
jgi:hypothetical protein